VQLTSREAFRGPLLWLSKLIFIPGPLHRLTGQLMASIKDVLTIEQKKKSGHFNLTAARLDFN
jgi:hypothetical protein